MLDVGGARSVTPTYAPGVGLVETGFRFDGPVPAKHSGRLGRGLVGPGSTLR